MSPVIIWRHHGQIVVNNTVKVYQFVSTAKIQKVCNSLFIIDFFRLLDPEGWDDRVDSE